MKSRFRKTFAAALGFGAALVASSAMAATFIVVSNLNGPLGGLGANTKVDPIGWTGIGVT